MKSMARLSLKGEKDSVISEGSSRLCTSSLLFKFPNCVRDCEEEIAIDINEKATEINNSFNQKDAAKANSLLDNTSDLNDVINAVNKLKLQVDQLGINLADAGCLLDNSGAASNNSIIIQKLIDSGVKNIFNPGIIYISTPIMIPPSFSGGKIYGVSWELSKFVMMSNNTPIIQTSNYNTYGVTLNEISFEYNNQQNPTSHPNSIAIYFYTPTDISYGFYHWEIKKVRINKATTAIGLCNTINSVVWGCKFEDLKILNTSKTAIDLRSNMGQLANHFINLKILNYSLRDPNGLHNSGLAIRITGEAIFDNIGIEDWWGNIFSTSDGFVWMSNIHIERHHLEDNSTYYKVFYIAGSLAVYQLFYRDGVIKTTNFVRLFDVASPYSKLYINTVTVLNSDTNTEFMLLNTTSNPQVNINNVRGIKVTSSLFNPDILTNTNLVIDSMPFNRLFRFSSPPSNVDVNQGDIFYSKSIISGQPIGWVAKCNSYASPIPIIGNCSVDNSNTITCMGIVATRAFKVGDGVVLGTVSDDIYTIIQIPDNSTIVVQEIVTETYNNVGIALADTSNKKVFKTFGLIQ